MASVTFSQCNTAPKPNYFADLNDNDSFRISSRRARGAVYRKVHFDNDVYYMLEEATGELFEPTNSPVELVKVTVSIDAVKPAIY